MNAPVSPREMAFAALCASRAQMLIDGSLLVCEAVDELQALAEHTGLIAAIGQDQTQRIMGEAFAVVDLMQYDAAQDELGEACEAEIMLRAADLVRRWELDDPRDRWRHTGEPRPSRSGGEHSPPREPYRPAQSTIDAFFYVVALDYVDRLQAWLDDHHPKDAPILLKLLKAKLCK